MTFEEAKTLLDKAHRDELVDYTFGDAEVDWFVSREDRTHLAVGYFSTRIERVTLLRGDGSVARFEGNEARRLRYCGVTVRRERNDEG